MGLGFADSLPVVWSDLMVADLFALRGSANTPNAAAGQDFTAVYSDGETSPS